MRIRFWGTRGSLPKPSLNVMRYGGNTSCVEIRGDDGTLLILDCGSGIHDLGQNLIASGQTPIEGHILITHTHWDHIQGFPFFVPLFIPGNSWEIYAPGGMGQELERTLAGQMSYNYFPVTLEEMGSKIHFNNIGEGLLDIGPFRVSTHYSNHPALTLGYRFEAGGKVVVYISDHEPNSLFPIDAPLGTWPVHHEDRKHVTFFEGADLLIHDAQYTLEEYDKRVGWGHTPIEKLVDYAIAGRIKKLALFHHDPLRDNDAIDDLVKTANLLAEEGDFIPEIFAAAEGQIIDLPEEASSFPPIDSGASAIIPSLPQNRIKTVLIVDDDPSIVRTLSAILKAENLEVLTAEDGESGAEIGVEEEPSLILLDLVLPGIDGLEVCRRLRANPKPRIRNIPIVILTGAKLEEKDLLECYEAGATDYLTKPFSPTQLRSRIREWLLRAEKL